MADTTGEKRRDCHCPPRSFMTFNWVKQFRNISPIIKSIGAKKSLKGTWSLTSFNHLGIEVGLDAAHHVSGQGSFVQRSTKLISNVLKTFRITVQCFR